MNEFQLVEQLEYRIGVDIKHFGGKLPERHAIAWRAYLAGIYEWGVIGLGALERLRKLLPDVEDDPVPAILVGRDEE